jgi:hypothetical protein
VTTAFSKNLALYKVKSDLKLANTIRNSTSWCCLLAIWRFLWSPISCFCSLKTKMFLLSAMRESPGKFYVEELEI